MPACASFREVRLLQPLVGVIFFLAKKAADGYDDLKVLRLNLSNMLTKLQKPGPGPSKKKSHGA